MPTVRELSDPYANFLLNPVAPGTAGTCSSCLTFTEGFATCYRCGHDRQYLDGVLPLSYSVHLGQLHTALYGYKRGRGSAADRFQIELSAVLWRFLARHEACLARNADVEAFPLVTSVPSSSSERDANQPLRNMLSRVVEHTAPRYERLLLRSSAATAERAVDPDKFEATRRIDAEAVLLVDDTWTTGATAQSAAGRLKEAGASTVCTVVLGRHIHEEYENNAARLRELPRPFDWNTCALE